ncbi:hypothetical protein AGABI2DRAFT_118236 [Agaricus bisporus var. bisporus H97]|uniref:hypothetical protein n=1 Tax=Agaricus bisporus var. bisporus (strain H97 / ATCC MYA-4626 / FGSC 10389) TaxID=936046 RepID=UPI00029F5117|nr:hypothetical protein AGABI2DRAFT_118236 [Agaricus bisporus var. bisporus H97]EKV47687.1 hypothetical protein AGABI2DRAFT_118236 [Agaricus bisporus var. bisporus H97]
MWRPFKRGRTAVKGIFKRRWFQRNRVTTIDAENDTDSVASSIDRCNRCECPRSCDCHCHIVAAPSPRNSLPVSSQDSHARCPNPSPQACSQSLVFSAQERANQVPTDDRGAETPRPCSSTGPAFTPPPPTLDYEKVETSQPPNCLLSASPPDSYLSYASIAALHQPPPDCVGKLRLPKADQDTHRIDNRLSSPSHSLWGVVSLPSVASLSPHAVQTPVEDNVAPPATQPYRSAIINRPDTSTTSRSSTATASTAAVTLIEGEQDLLNFPDVGQALSGSLFSPTSPQPGPSQHNVSQASTSHAVNHNRASFDRTSPLDAPFLTRPSALSGGYTDQNHAILSPSEHSAIGETLGDAQTQTYDNGADSLLFSGRAASSNRFPFISRSEQLNASGAQPFGEPSHLVGHSLLDAMAEVGGYSTSGSPTAARPSPLGYYAIRVNATIEATRLASHLDSVLDHHLQRIAEGTTLSWALAHESQKQVFIGLLCLRRLIERMRQHVHGAQTFVMLDTLWDFEGELNRLTTMLDSLPVGSDAILAFTLSCLALPERFNKLYEEYEERAIRAN